jgi:hypothetical protein
MSGRPICAYCFSTGLSFSTQSTIPANRLENAVSDLEKPRTAAGSRGSS